MNNVDFHKLNEKIFKNYLGKYKKGKRRSSWRYEISDSLTIEFAARIHQHGWNPFLGSSFVYDVTPIYKGKEYYPEATQLRLYELSHYDPELVESAKKILNVFASKLPVSRELEQDDYYILLKSPWTLDKVIKHEGGWYYFYDSDDLEAWHKANEATLSGALEEKERYYSRYDFARKSSNRESPKRVTLYKNIETGEFDLKDIE